MFDVIHDLPAERLALYCILLTVGATWIGVLFVKPVLRLLIGREGDINATIGIGTSVFGLFYGLLVGLLAVAAYQNAETIERAAFREAASVSNLYASLQSYPDPFRSDVRAMLRDYVLYTIHKDWPAHRAGRIMIGGGHRADAIRGRLAGFEPESTSQEIVHREVVGALQDFAVARQERLAGTLTRIPGVLWGALAAGALVNIVFIVLLKLKPIPHMILGGLSSFFLGVMLFVILALDDPMRGETGLEPEAMRFLWETRMAFDEPAA